jgi:uncharacterized membrane protein YphA (DoxX/SURF4 family)
MPRSLGPIHLNPRSLLRQAPVLWLVTIGALLVRLYLASLWFRFGMAKVEAGWLTLNPVRGLLGGVAAGQTPMPLPSLSIVAGWLLAIRADALLSVVVPLTEIVLAAAFLTGWHTRRAALVGIAINASLILGGLATVPFDGRIIALQTAVILAGKRAGLIGAPGIARLRRVRRPRIEGLFECGTGPEPSSRAA